MKLTYKAGVKVKQEKAEKTVVEKTEPAEDVKPVEKPRGKRECMLRRPNAR